MLVVENISTGYNKNQVIFDISFEVKEGETVILTGENGSGKSTVLKCIFGILKPWDIEGNILFYNKSLIGKPSYELIKMGIVYIPQKNNIFESLTVAENLAVSGSFYDPSEFKQRQDDVYKLPGLFVQRNLTPFNLSGGERQMLAIGNALMHRPKLLIFDEPLAGLDDINRDEVIKSLKGLKDQGTSLLIAEHKIKELSLLNPRIINIYLGRISDNP